MQHAISENKLYVQIMIPASLYILLLPRKQESIQTFELDWIGLELNGNTMCCNYEKVGNETNMISQVRSSAEGA